MPRETVTLVYKIWLTGAEGIAVAMLRRRRGSVLVVGDEVDVDLVLLLGYEAPLFLVGGELLRRRDPLLEEDLVDISVPSTPLMLLLLL